MEVSKSASEVARKIWYTPLTGTPTTGVPIMAAIIQSAIDTERQKDAEMIEGLMAAVVLASKASMLCNSRDCSQSDEQSLCHNCRARNAINAAIQKDAETIAQLKTELTYTTDERNSAYALCRSRSEQIASLTKQVEELQTETVDLKGQIIQLRADKMKLAHEARKYR